MWLTKLPYFLKLSDFLKIRPNSWLILKIRPNACRHLKNLCKLRLRPKFGLRTKSDLIHQVTHCNWIKLLGHDVQNWSMTVVHAVNVSKTTGRRGELRRRRYRHFADATQLDVELCRYKRAFSLRPTGHVINTLQTSTFTSNGLFLCWCAVKNLLSLSLSVLATAEFLVEWLGV